MIHPVWQWIRKLASHLLRPNCEPCERHGYYRLRLERLEYRVVPTLIHDTLGTAHDLSFDSVTQQARDDGNLADSNSVDLYSVHLWAGDEIAAGLFAQSPGAFAGCLRIFDASGHQQAFQEYSGVLTGNPKLTFSPGAGSTGTITRSVGSWSNDGFQVSQSIRVSGTRNSNDGTDLIKSISSDGTTLTLTLAPGAVFAYESTSGGIAVTPLDTELAFDAMTDGVYYVGISSNGNFRYDATRSDSGRGGTTAGSYNLTLTDKLGAILATEVSGNNTVNTAQTIAGNSGDSTIAGKMVLKGRYVNATTEYYNFTESVTGGLTATVTPGDGAAFLPRLALYSNTGRLLIQADAVDLNHASVTLNQNLQPGAYYLGVQSVADSNDLADDQSYLLATTFNLAQPPFQPLSVGASPEGVATGDFNHDGTLDLVTANYDLANSQDNTVSVLLGNGDGTFQTSTEITVQNGSQGVGPKAVAVGDFRHDGNLDMVTANYVDGTVSVFLGNGNGTFQDPVTYKVGNSPIAVAVGDFNGQLGIVTANVNYDPSTNTDGPGTVSVLLGDGSGTFQKPAVTYNVGTKPFDIAVGNFNGYVDIVTANEGDSTVSVLLGDGTGDFHSPFIYSTRDSASKGINPFGVTVGDLNGRPAIVTANYGDGTVSVLLGAGGAFQPAVTYPVQLNPYAVVIGDFDGQPDIAVVNHFSNSVSMLLGNRDGTFQPAISYSVGHQPYGLTAGDFNQDGKFDLAVTDSLDNTVSLLSGKGDGTLVAPLSLAVGQRPFAVAKGDFNHDGNLDLATANDGANTVSVLLGNSGGTFQPQVNYAVGENPDSLYVGDVNKDGSPDIVTSNAGDNSVSVLLGLGDGSFLLPPLIFKVGKDPSGVALADVNGDSILDVVTTNAGDNTVSVLLGNGDGNFQPAVTYSTEDSSGKGTVPKSVTIGNFNGHLDIVTANAGDNTVSVLMGDGKGAFQHIAVTYAVGEDPLSVAVANFNGRPDIVTANFGYNPVTKKDDPGTVSVLLSDSGGLFQPAVDYQVGSLPQAVAVGDFNNDGHLDIATSNYGGNNVSVLLGNKDGTFQPSTVLPVGNSPHGIAAGDFNNDDNTDIVVANLGDSSVSLLLGTGVASFRSTSTYPLPHPPLSVAVAFGDNGNDIVATANGQDNSVSVLLGNPDGTVFQTAIRLSTKDSSGNGTDPVAVAAGNDNNGNVLIATADAGDSRVSVWVGNVVDQFQNVAVTYSTADVNGYGINPVAVTVNNDNNGNIVIVTANADNTVSVFTDDGTGNDTFLPAITYSTADSAGLTGVAMTVDANNNFVIVTTNRDNTVSILIAGPDPNGLGTSFPAAAIIRSTKDGAGNGTDPVAVDATNDAAGNIIIVTANGDRTVSVLRDDNGDDSFQNPVVTYSVGGVPAAIAVKIDANNNLDIFTANPTDDTVSVLLGNNRDGTSFEPATAYPVGNHPVGIALAGDTHDNLDIITANAGDSSVSVLLGNTQFHAATPENSIVMRNIPYFQDFSGARDRTGHSINDELILDSAGGILFRQGLGAPGQFAPPVVINPDFRARDVAVFRRADGWSVAAVDVAKNTVSIYSWNSNTRFFKLSSGFATGDDPVRIAAADLNGDWLDDLVVANNFDHSLTIAFQSPTGAFNTWSTRLVGMAPSAISFANLGASNGPDIVVSDQASGDFSVLANDPSHSFDGQSRFRAASGSFDINVNPVTAEETVVSQLQTVGIAAGAFTGADANDVITLNRGATNFTLYAGQRTGSFAAPLSTPTGAEPGQIAALTLPDDTLPSVAILMENTSPHHGQIWIYRNNGDGSFAAPVKIDAGAAPSGFSIMTVHGQPALLVGNAHGDILTLLYDGNSGFSPDRANLQSVPLTLTDANGDVFLADQKTDQAFFLRRIPGTTRFDNPVHIDDAAHLLAPGAVQSFDVKVGRVATTYLAVANSLSNTVLIYKELSDGRISSPTAMNVGDNPVAITVADVNGDQVPDLMVANQGSNDVSVLIGRVDPFKGWGSTSYQRLASGGSGPVAVGVRTLADSTHGPDLLVINGDGKAVTMPGIGAGGSGSGFFQDANPQPIDLANPIRQGAFDPKTGEEMVVRGDGGISAFDGSRFVSVFNPDGPGVTTIGLEGDTVAVGFADGTVGLLSRDAAGTFSLTSEAAGFEGQVSALQVLQGANGVEVYVTRTGSDLPQILTAADFISLTTELRTGTVIAESISLPEANLVLVAVLLTGSTSGPVFNDSGPVVNDVAFVSFSPSILSSAQSTNDSEVPGEAVIIPVPLAGSDLTRQAAWEQFRSGVEESFRQEHWLREGEHLSQEMLEIMQRMFDQIQIIWQNQTAPQEGAYLSPLLPYGPDTCFLWTAKIRVCLVEPGWMPPVPEILQGPAEKSDEAVPLRSMDLVLPPTLATLLQRSVEKSDEAAPLESMGLILLPTLAAWLPRIYRRRVFWLLARLGATRLAVRSSARRNADFTYWIEVGKW